MLVRFLGLVLQGKTSGPLLLTLKQFPSLSCQIAPSIYFPCNKFDSDQKILLPPKPNTPTLSKLCIRMTLKFLFQ